MKSPAPPPRQAARDPVVLQCIAAYDANDAAALARVEASLPKVRLPKDRSFIHKTLGLHALMRAQDPAAAMRHLEAALRYQPDDVETTKNIGVVLLRMQRFDDAATHLEKAALRHPNNYEIQDGLCHAYGRLDRLVDAHRAGTRALELKDRAATGPGRDLSKVPVPPFNGASRQQNVISFSLYGNRDKYIRGAVRNAEAAPFLYPGWVCRFHVDDSVPEAARTQLTRLGAQVIRVEGLPAARYGTSWRFLAPAAPGVVRCLFRDCDSVINIQERVAVDEWIASGRHFHVMRDRFTHSELVLAGMWGAVAGAVPDMLAELTDWMKQTKQLVHRAMDQWFLRDRLWPTMRQSVLSHDSQFAFGEVRPFPPYGRLPPDQHVGQNLFGA